MERELPYFYPNLFSSLGGLVVFALFFCCCNRGIRCDRNINGKTCETICCGLASCCSLDCCCSSDEFPKWDADELVACSLCSCVIFWLPFLVFNIVFMWIGGVGELIIVLSVLCLGFVVYKFHVYVRAKRRRRRASAGPRVTVTGSV